VKADSGCENRRQLGLTIIVRTLFSFFITQSNGDQFA